ncbi:MAG TPA: T9SS type A sorting domain-containing protein [Flavobacterium sp.]|nr:T9SS type A sorting domain-containing protein [Flavobacterium sp.]
MRNINSFFIFILLISSLSSLSQATIDSGFGNGGKVITPISNAKDGIYGLAIQDDHKILACGMSYNGTKYLLTITRYLSNGNLDLTFGTGGTNVTNFGSRYIHTDAIALQSDGKILIGGTHDISVTPTIMDLVFVVLRFNIDGSADSTFGINGSVVTDFSPLGNGGIANGIKSLLVQPDNKILVTGFGSAVSGDSGSNFELARYNADGTLDSSFGTAGKADINIGLTTTANNFQIPGYDYPTAIKLQDDGKIVITGFSNAGRIYGEGSDLAVVRLDTDGNLDSSFGTNGKVTYDLGGFEDGFSLQMTPDHKIIVGGNAYLNDDYDHCKIVLCKLNNDGSLDATFGINGKVTTQINTVEQYDSLSSLVLEDDGKILATGHTLYNQKTDFLLLRYNADGTLDNSFAAGYLVTTDFINSNDKTFASILQNDGKIVLAGTTDANGNYDFGLVRYSLNNLSATAFSSEKFLVYPNPATSILYVSDNDDIQTINIYNNLGQLVISNPEKKNIDISALAFGQYLIKITTSNSFEVRKFLKK